MKSLFGSIWKGSKKVASERDAASEDWRWTPEDDMPDSRFLGACLTEDVSQESPTTRSEEASTISPDIRPDIRDVPLPKTSEENFLETLREMRLETHRSHTEDVLSVLENIEKRLDEIAQSLREPHTHPDDLVPMSTLLDPQTSDAEEKPTTDEAGTQSLSLAIDDLVVVLAEMASNHRVVHGDESGAQPSEDLRNAEALAAFLHQVRQTLLGKGGVDFTAPVAVNRLALENRALREEVRRHYRLLRKYDAVFREVRHGYHVSRTAHSICLDIANRFSSLYLEQVVRPFYGEDATLESATDFPKSVRSSLVKAGYRTFGEIAELNQESLYAISGMGARKIAITENYFKERGMPAMFLHIPFIGEIVTPSKVQSANADPHYLWELPKCYGEKRLLNNMGGLWSGIMVWPIDKLVKTTEVTDGLLGSQEQT